MEVITSVVTDKDTGIRVDIYVAKALDISRSYAGNLIKNGKVSMRDRILKANYRVRKVTKSSLKRMRLKTLRLRLKISL